MSSAQKSPQDTVSATLALDSTLAKLGLHPRLAAVFQKAVKIDEGVLAVAFPKGLTRSVVNEREPVAG